MARPDPHVTIELNAEIIKLAGLVWEDLRDDLTGNPAKTDVNQIGSPPTKFI